MSQDQQASRDQQASEDHLTPKIVDARRREMAVEHLVFGTIGFLARRHPELLDHLEGSLDHLWDPDEGAERNDEAVRNIARRLLKSLRAQP